jgi:hypothetical protein
MGAAQQVGAQMGQMPPISPQQIAMMQAQRQQPPAGMMAPQPQGPYPGMRPQPQQPAGAYGGMLAQQLGQQRQGGLSRMPPTGMPNYGGPLR